MRERFPHPYTIDDVRRFITLARGGATETIFAVTANEVAVGAMSAILGDDIEHCSPEVGHWLGEPCWSRGNATRALTGFTRFALAAYDLEELYAVPFASNSAACHVLQKAGYRIEGRMCRSAIEDGMLRDQFLYAILRSDGPTTEGS